MTCIVPDCKSKWRSQEISFHAIPKKNFGAWLTPLGIRATNWESCRKKKVCSRHFEERWFDRTGQTVRLRLGAIPTLYLPVQMPAVLTETDSEVIVENHELDTMEVEKTVLLECESEPETSQSMRDNDMTSSSEIKVELNPCSPLESESLVSSTCSPTSEELTRTREFIATIHSYSCSPDKYKKKCLQLQGQIVKYRKRLSASKTTITDLRAKIQALKQVVKMLEKYKAIAERT